MSQIQKLGPNSGGPVGDVVGPASSTDGAIALFDGTTGKLLKESLTIQQCATVSTSDATPTALITVALDSVDAVYFFKANISAFDTTNTLGASYSVEGCIRTDGTDSTLCGVPDKITNEEAGVTDADISATAGGVADNNLYINVTGIAATDINWAGCVSTIKVN